MEVDSIAPAQTLRRKRAQSAPAMRKVARTTSIEVDGPDPWAILEPLGDKATRIATALNELALQTSHMPETWRTQDAVAEAATHEILQAHERSWRNGIAHGKWLHAQEIEQQRRELDNYAAVQAKLCDLQLRFDVLLAQYEEAKAIIARSTLRDISNRIV